MTTKPTAEEWWRALLTGEGLKMPLREMRHVLRFLPSHARCKFCNSRSMVLGRP